MLLLQLLLQLSGIIIIIMTYTYYSVHMSESQHWAFPPEELFCVALLYSPHIQVNTSSDSNAKYETSCLFLYFH